MKSIEYLINSNTYEIENEKRYDFIDIARGILIILVVIGHSGSLFTPYIYLFHMAAFIFLSGYLFKNKTAKLSSLLSKRIKTLYLPYIKYQLIFLMLYNFFILIGIYSRELVYYSFLDFLKAALGILLFGGNGGQLLGAFWYIVLLFEVSVIYSVVHYWTLRFSNRDIIRGIIFVTMFILGIIFINMGYGLPRHLDTAFILILVFYSGVLYKQNENYVPIKLSFFILSLCLLIILNQFGIIDVGRNIYTSAFFFLISTTSGVYVIIYISKKLSKFCEFRILKFIGRNTLTILALHFLSFKLVNLLIIKINSYPY
ncbi:acyltransferase family protein, partial [Paenibacillus odorifer]